MKPAPKNIFQEKFASFEAEPDNDVWEKISEELHPVSRKIIVPLWLRYMGVAASIALVVGVTWQLGKRQGISQTGLSSIATQTQTIPNTPTNTNAENVAPQPNEPTPSQTVSHTSAQTQTRFNTKTGTVERVRTMLVQVTESFTEDAARDLLQGKQNVKPISSETNTREVVAVPVEKRAVQAPAPNTEAPKIQAAAPELANETYVVYEVVKPKIAAPANNANTNLAAGSKSELRLDNLNSGSILGFAAEQVNRLLNNPVKVQSQNVGDKTNKSLEYKTKNFSITRKTSREKGS